MLDKHVATKCKHVTSPRSLRSIGNINVHTPDQDKYAGNLTAIRALTDHSYTVKQSSTTTMITVHIIILLRTLVKRRSSPPTTVNPKLANLIDRLGTLLSRGGAENPDDAEGVDDGGTQPAVVLDDLPLERRPGGLRLRRGSVHVVGLQP
jgi:hypothetical protein